MSVLLYLLPLGLIFDIVGYVPPEGRLFLIYGLLALPLCLKPSKTAGWMGLALVLVMALRAAVPMPVVAETALLLAVHLAIWSVLAPVPRGLKAGVVAYTFIHLLLFDSPLGHTTLEAMTDVGNQVVGWVTGQSFHLGPSYLSLGSLLLFLTLSVFAWDGSKVPVLRTGGFLLVAVLLTGLAAVILVGKADFAASFAWTLKFRDRFGFAELWTHLKGLAVIVFPGFLFLAQLLAFAVLHFGAAETASDPQAEAPGWPGLVAECRFGKRVLIVAVMAALAVAGVAPPTSRRRPAPCDLVFLERGVVSFTKPDFTRYGEAAGGMFGMLPEYAKLFGCKAEVVKEIPAVLDTGKTLVVTNLDEDLGTLMRERIRDFVSKGGRLWVLGDHTFIKNGRNHLNELLEPWHISFNNDSAQFFPQGWFHSYRFPQGTPFSGLHDDAENRPGILVGASLETNGSAQPFVLGRFGYGDLGLEVPEGDRGYLGDFKYQPAERLGDLVLVAGECYGQGRVLVFGDTSSFFNNNLSRSFELLRASLGWLGESDRWTFQATPAGRWLVTAWVAALVLVAFFWRARAIAVAGLAAAGLVSLVSHGDGGLPEYEPEFSRGHLAVIDFSHQPNASKHSAMENGLHGVAINFLRHGILPITANEWDPALLGNARYLVLSAPRRPITEGERGDLMRFMRSGGWVILGCGYLDGDGCEELLESLGCRISDVPLGRFFDLKAFGQPVSFMSAWAIAKVPPNAEILCKSADWPLIVSLPAGKGGLVLVGDSEFLHNRNVEGHKNHDPANTTFLKNLLDHTNR
jgi:hypothetical protein